MWRIAEGVLSRAKEMTIPERWPSGRRRTLGKRVYGNVSWVRIPPSPPNVLDEALLRRADRRRGAGWRRTRGGVPDGLPAGPGGPTPSPRGPQAPPAPSGARGVV